MSKTALIILHEGFEEMEAIAPIDILRRGEVEVTVASREFHTSVKGRNAISVKADVLLDEALKKSYDCLILPGGPGVAKLRSDRRVLDAIKRHHQEGRLVAAICAAPLCLLDAGLLPGKPFTSHPTTANELPGRDPQQAVVSSGNILTSQGAGTATAFALAVLAQLTDETTACQVADSICLSAPQ
ncbi:DJ-1/PfpI family protein [Ruficoccus amylovorans]|uniref:DJ-1/PfpI family protein n=1 Tax=Ruficoccus amylovorans TaxID=1804625 RepID=A0A842HH25_9BACT|nr:DJ-1 family glyoxalase III [Ruficoccus amylovorans]MBC2595298.1 DJ-1/PfpI family protein [Ruficoccus amylovorans]